MLTTEEKQGKLLPYVDEHPWVEGYLDALQGEFRNHNHECQAEYDAGYDSGVLTFLRGTYER